MAVSKKDVEYIANLARLEFSSSEIENFTDQLNQILQYVDKLNELDTDNIEPLSHPVENVNVFRDDILKPTVSRMEALKNAPEANDEFFKVPKIIKVD
ncbi:MAG: Asp-tRNA(Asn)/Glu-tRNA(Gln) amidotransferase GatCAB subunit C [Ignavibacteriae bacterium HGW-Ignavibacteriae-2]|jgi:aspartyl-tRNA(Asn)/glutamyl-tRNA(Gln) amidotransferase subunit C|nr:MAG: Asp-tRNA(Asn)/Glu-tRNA(Gln) amidotransferase GatCAB subunit C [Ignavibacteriae bacterium HGW-Ignavibacteriae-2]